MLYYTLYFQVQFGMSVRSKSVA